MRSPGHRRERTNFLTLPRELRQKILHLSFEQATAKDYEFNGYSNALRMAVHGPYVKDEVHPLPHTAAWAHGLVSVHSVIEEDLGYVLEQVVRDVEWPFVPKNHNCGEMGRWRVLLGRKSSFQSAASKRARMEWGWSVNQDPKLRVMIKEAIYPGIEEFVTEDVATEREVWY